MRIFIICIVLVFMAEFTAAQYTPAEMDKYCGMRKRK
jgi:hypothetical protein